jgi:hypothetical protein
MSEYRNRSTGEVQSQGAIRRAMPNTSLPRVWNESICDSLGIDPVLAAPAPTPSGEYKSVYRDGVVQDALGNWVQAYAERDMFSAYVTEDDVAVTKSSQEEAYTASKTAEAATAARNTRDGLIASSDWRAIKAFEAGATVGADWATYRQALRDITDQAGFPTEIVWPEKP